MLCISTSEQVLPTLYTGQNNIMWIFTSFSITMGKKMKSAKNKETRLNAGWHTMAGGLLGKIFCLHLLALSCFFSFLHEKHWKSIFLPAFGVCSNQMLVKIYTSNPLLTWFGPNRSYQMTENKMGVRIKIFAADITSAKPLKKLMLFQRFSKK